MWTLVDSAELIAVVGALIGAIFWAIGDAKAPEGPESKYMRASAWTFLIVGLIGLVVELRRVAVKIRLKG